ncbi:MAG: CFI-box-CTERM domain-containing protein [Thermodesulfobacteriota bacterium]|nr:CFI-box-CTERM domain-containing protein [Thermodesulfobacteriota bacterium]
MKSKLLCVWVGLMIALVPTSALADATLSLGDVSGEAGTQVTVSVTLSSNPQNVSSMNFIVEFDPALLEYLSAQGTALVTDVPPGGAEKQFEVFSPQDGEVRVVIYGMNQNIIPDGVVANIRFRIMDNAPAGDISLDLGDLVTCTGGAVLVLSTSVDACVTCSGGGSSSVVSDGGGNGCFIATAAFGSKMERHVSILSDFRDQCLLNHKIGRRFVELYYRFSPPVADSLRAHPILKAATRYALIPVTGAAYLVVQGQGHLLWIPLALFLGLIAFFVRRYSLKRTGKRIRPSEGV